MIDKLSRRAAQFAKRMADDMRGIAAVEFAYIAPIMMIMLLGTVEVSRAVSIDRRFGLVTSTVGDLVAREKTMTAADLNAIYNIVAHIMSPYDSSTLKIAVIPVKADPSDKDSIKVYAATTNRPTYHGATLKPKCEDYPMTADLLSAGSSVIVVESSYQFTPLLTGDIIGATTWDDKATLSPRNSCVDFDDDNCVSTCF
jgi:Flp pilus assembly protein TadG